MWTVPLTLPLTPPLIPSLPSPLTPCLPYAHPHDLTLIPLPLPSPDTHPHDLTPPLTPPLTLSLTRYFPSRPHPDPRSLSTPWHPYAPAPNPNLCQPHQQNPDVRLASHPRCTRLQQVLHKSNKHSTNPNLCSGHLSIL